jgi:hypothetical protein
MVATKQANASKGNSISNTELTNDQTTKEKYSDGEGD